jgi:drug/metabolite transporter (DMT)-like permease
VPAVALGLLLAAAVAHATWNYFAKGANSSLAFTFAFAAFAELVYLPLAIGVFLWTRPSLGLDALLFVTVSGALNVAYFLLLGEGYKAGDLSLVYPLARGTGPALSVAGAVLIFGERPSPLALVGAGLVIAGIIVMSWSPNAASRADIGRSVAFALATGACIAAYTLWDNKGVTIVTPVLYCYGLDLARALIIAPFVVATAAGRETVAAVFREQRRAVMAIGILSPGAYILVLAALTIAPVSYVAPAREIGIVFGALYGAAALGEGHLRPRVTGAVAILSGVVLIAAA